MRTIILFALAFLLSSGCSSDWASRGTTVPVPLDADFRSVLLLSDGHGHLASGFLLAVSGRQYVVTARHFAAYMHGEDSIEIYVNGGWLKTPTRLIGHASGEADVSVFSFRRPVVVEAGTPALSANESLARGAETWYLGFPLGYLFEGARNYPYPLLKHAYLSTQNDEPYLYYFDGLCNPGFSGGPVYARTTQGDLRLIGVVSARLKESSDAQSSGIFLAYSVRYTLALIARNPVGAELH